MAKIKGDVIDFEGIESGGGGGARVPEDNYRLAVDSVERGESKSSGNSMLIWGFKITKGKHKGKKLKKVYATLTVESLWKLKNILEALGIEADKVSIKKTLKEAPGKECGGTVIDGEEYKGKIPSEIAEFMTIKDLESQGDDDDDDDEPKAKKGKKKDKGKKGKKKDDDEEIESIDVDDEI